MDDAPVGAATSYVVYSAAIDGRAQVLAAIEDGSSPPAQLSASGVDTIFAGELSNHRALLAERDGQGRLVRLVVASTNGVRTALGDLAAGAYQAIGKVVSEGDVIVVELVSASDLAVTDLLALRAGAEPQMVVRGASSIALANGRVAYRQAGALRSVKLDGSATVELGSGDGHDEVAEVRDGKLLVTLHAGTGQGTVRLVSIDGSERVDFAPAGDEAAFAIAGDRADRIVLSRKLATGTVLVSASATGSDSRVLTDEKLVAQPLQIGAGGVTFTAGSSLGFVPLDGGAARTLDAAAGEIVALRLADDRVVYTGRNDDGIALKSARLDGSGVQVLSSKPLWLPFLQGIVGDRVIFHRALVGQLEGGQVFSVKLDGTDLRALGTSIAGDLIPPLDQDFEAVTPSGRVILEAEIADILDRRLLFTSAASKVAGKVTSTSAIRFAGLIR